MEKRLIAAALPYINNIPHLGHIVGSHLPADIFARYCRLKGHDTLFVGGSDENGTPSELAAESIGVELSVFLNEMFEEHKRIYDWFNISYDNFSRTSREIHHKTTKEFFEKIYGNGFIESGKVKSFYCEKDDRYLPDRYVKGTCPKCGYENANADQCEQCTALQDPEKLLNVKCSICRGTPVIKETVHLFLRLDKLSPELEEWIKKNAHWRLQVRNLALGWIKEGLKPRCITRDLKHGVKVPLKGFEEKVFYVWFDAPIGYVSSTREITPEWKDYWKNAKIYNFLGKDNIPFHTIFWPGTIMAEGEFSLPFQVVGLQYLNYEEGKFSKSQKRGVFCEKLPESGVSSDVIRAYLTFLIPETADTEFRWDDFQAKINNDLIGNYGNFVNRTISFIHSRLSGKIEMPLEKELSGEDKEFFEIVRKKTEKIEMHFEKIELRNAFREILAVSAEGNRYFNNNEPWNCIKNDKKKANRVLFNCAVLCKALAVVSSPFLPETSEKIWKQLGLKGIAGEKGNWENALEMLPERHVVKKPEILFKKLSGQEIGELKKTVSDARKLEDYFTKKR